MKKTCIIIAGPTAVGKTAIAIELAKHFHTEIISADSRQCFLEMNTGVAKPSTAELAAVHHYFINSHSIHDEVNAAVFESYALQSLAAIFQKNDVAVMTGGTGLYIKAFTDGIDPIPETDPAIRNEILQEYHAGGLAWLQEQVRKQDPAFFAKGEIKNPQRLMRALEVKRSTGMSLFDFHTQSVKKRDFTIIKTGLELPRAELYSRINNRVDAMLDAGLEAEAEALLPYRHLNALQTVGYRELFDYFRGDCSREQAVTAIKTNTRHYAKRQLTWFRRDTQFRWCEPRLELVMKQVKDEMMTGRSNH